MDTSISRSFKLNSKHRGKVKSDITQTFLHKALALSQHLFLTVMLTNNKGSIDRARVNIYENCSILITFHFQGR